MFRDSLGNTYRSLPPRKPNPSAKPSASAFVGRKGRKNRKNSGEWQRKVKSREAAHKAAGHKFTSYPC